jgi:hypothetical protein
LIITYLVIGIWAMKVKQPVCDKHKAEQIHQKFWALNKRGPQLFRPNL